MQALSGLDASFLYLETPNMPMHVGGVSIIEGSLDFETFRNLLASRVHLSRSLYQRLVTVPLSLDRPYWIEDPNFNLDYHLHHTALPRPGGWRQLRKLASRLFGQPLDRSRPLWEIVFVEGLDTIPQVPAGSVALISKIHHSAIDGMSGADIVGLLYDITTEPRHVPPPPPPTNDRVPGDVELVLRSAYNFATRPLKLPRLILETAKATAKAGYLTRVQGLETPTLPFSAPRSRLNVKVSADRVWNTALLDLARVKALRQPVPDSTVNDVLLTICAGALRRYLQEKDALPRKPLVAMVPVSTRTKDEKNTMGNQVSAMFIPLATDIEDHIERLRKIHHNTVTGKSYQGALDAKSLMDYAEFIPFGVAGQAARVYSRANISRRHNPFFNVVITNVPGPQIPLYMDGHQLLAHMGMAPIFDGMGLILPIFSYNGLVSISPTSARNVMPDMNVFARYLREVANEMEVDVLSYLEHHTVKPAAVAPAAEPEVARCEALTKSGNRCRNRAVEGEKYCHIHQPNE